MSTDRSRTFIAAAWSRHAGSGFEFVVADGVVPPFADRSFNAVRIDRSLQHIADPGRIVREMARGARRASDDGLPGSQALTRHAASRRQGGCTKDGRIHARRDC